MAVAVFMFATNMLVNKFATIEEPKASPYLMSLVRAVANVIILTPLGVF